MEEKPKKRRKIPKGYWSHKLHKYIALTGSAIILLLVVLNVFKKDEAMSEKENRVLESRPKISASKIADGSFMKDYETYQSDQFVFRNLWMSLKTSIDRLSGKNYSGGVYRGHDGYLIGEPVEPDEENLQKNIRAINQLADSGSIVYTMIVPNAAAVLSDCLPLFAPVRSQTDDLQHVRTSLSGNVKDIDVFDALSEHKEEQLYYHTDHHWTTTGAYYSFLEAAAVMGIDGNAVTYEKYKISDDFSGTMASTSGYRGKEDIIEAYIPTNSSVKYVIEYVEEQKKLTSVYQTENLEGYDQYSVFMGGNSPILRIKTTVASDRRLLLIKDSYANCFIPFLIPYYNEIVVIDPRYYYGDIYAEMASEKTTEILFLYNANTFLEDSSIAGIFQQENISE